MNDSLVTVDQLFSGQLKARVIGVDSIFKRCVFADADAEGAHVVGMFVACRFERLDCYWALFNNVVFVDSRFEACVFRGASFAACRFLNCEFVDCRFELDSFGKGCNFDDSTWFGGRVTRCMGLPGDAFRVESIT